jgi:parallel beta-helix repeat protein
MGAIRVGYSRGAIVTGNVIARAYRNGIVLTSSDAVVTGNQISDIAGRKATGIAVTGPGQRVIRDNLFRNVRNVYR